MAQLKDLTVWMENKPATLAAMAEASSKAKVNILAFMTDEAEGQSRVRLVTDNPAKAGKTVTGHKFAILKRGRGCHLSQQARNTGLLGNSGVKYQPRLQRDRKRLEEAAGCLCRERSEAGREHFGMNEKQFSMDWKARRTPT
jgi:hypothetical protein